ncbi:MAG: hypothetical protein ACREMQ_09245 [Longimicrobiales bacterium]
MGRYVAIAALGLLQMSCGRPPALAPLPANTFAFGVFGDGPYRPWQMARFSLVIEDVNSADLEWFLHVGDILAIPCSDEVFANRLEAMNSIRHPVIYTPGDNEWTDCHAHSAGSFQPHERLRRIRSTFFARPGESLGSRVMRVQSQGEDPAFAEFVENVRWRRGGFLFTTIHMVGAGNASDDFPERTPADDQEVARRTRAGLAWLDETFRIARSDSMKGVVLAMHANPGLNPDPEQRDGYGGLLDHLADLVRGFPGQVLLIHGDSHTQRVDHTLLDRGTGRPLPNFTRLETYGSPEIGWVQVVVDSVAGRVVGYDRRLMPAWRLW